MNAAQLGADCCVATEPEILTVERQDNAVRLMLKVPPTLCWFEGHFSQVALLPGVVQTTWAVQFARCYFLLPPQFCHMSNLKFMRLILPNTVLELRLRYYSDKRELSFEYYEGAAICASGRLGFAAEIDG